MPFNSPEPDYPRKWRDMSFDLRAMFGYHLCMMALFASGGAVSFPVEVAIVVAVFSVVAVLVAGNKVRKGWRRPATTPGNWLMSGLALLIGGVFLAAASPLFRPTQPVAFPWYAAGFGIVLFNALAALRIMQNSNDDFLACCNNAKTSAIAPVVAPDGEPGWKKTARNVYSVAFMVAWLTFVAFFYEFGTTFKNGSPIPTADKTETLVDHGRVAYVSAQDKQTVSRLEDASMTGIPIVLGLGFLLHFGLGVRVFSNLKRGGS